MANDVEACHFSAENDGLGPEILRRCSRVLDTILHASLQKHFHIRLPKTMRSRMHFVPKLCCKIYQGGKMLELRVEDYRLFLKHTKATTV